MDWSGGARSNGGVEIASVSCHRVSQEAVDTCEQLSSTLTRPTTHRRRYSCDVLKTVQATEATHGATLKAIATAVFGGHASQPG